MSAFLQRIERLSPKRLMLLALELQERVEELERKQTEPVAIIGIGCRAANGVDGPASFWKLLAEGVDTIAEVPPDRWLIDEYYDPDAGAPGRMCTRWGSFMRDVDRFDAGFFNISRREADSVDPQQRLLLEVCWEALEHAGWSPRQLSGGDTGVFVGISTGDYQTMLLARGDEHLDVYAATGGAHSIAAGRVSYALGLQGPSMAVDTACSSSLVAVHLAVQSLRAGECRMALAGGVNAILSPEVTIALSQAQMMSPGGRCKAFDAAADGFVRGEGCGIVVLKKLTDAVADRDSILGVLRGSAVNQDGRSSGITAPNGSAQEAVVRRALTNAGVQAHEIDYVEAHGTGTALGDPIEAHALAAVLREGRETPLILGSVKTNVGHLEAAAGVIGLIKTVLALEHEQIPPHLHFRQWNPNIQWNGMPVTIPVQGAPWVRGARRRLAGVSSFGFSGTNAHVIVGEAPEPETPACEWTRPQHILALSARSETALDALRERYIEDLPPETTNLGDICFTANAGRAPLEQRVAYVAADREQLQQSLSAKPVARGKKTAAPDPVFLFPGQGAQYAGMGRELYQTHPKFRHALEECAELLKPELPEPLLEVLWGTRTDLLDQTSYTQPALFALEYALAELWRSWKIEPAAVLGHSVGEYAAACVAGVYDLPSGLKFIARRAALMQAVGGQGVMTAVMASESLVRDALQGLSSQVSIAALNAPDSLVIAGYAGAVEIVEQRLTAAGARLTRLAVSHAFHSPQMKEMEAAFEEIARQMNFTAPRVQLISSVTGKAVSSGEMANSSYWRKQIGEPVRFQAAIETLDAKGFRTFLEVGPGRTLTGLARQTVNAAEAHWTTSLRKGRGEWTQMLESLGQLWVRGVEVDWAEFDRPYHRSRVPLPTYPFERQRYWIENAVPRRGGKSSAAAAQDVALSGDLFYYLSWQARAEREVPGPRKGGPGRVLILSDAGGIGKALATEFVSAGATAVIDGAVEAGPWNHIIDLRAVGAPGLAPLSAREVGGDALDRAAAPVETLQAMLRAQSEAKLWVITQGAQTVMPSQTAIAPTEATAWGVARCIRLEHSGLWGGILDLDPEAPVEESARQCLRALQGNDGEDQLAFRHGQRYVPRLMPGRVPAPTGLRIRPDRIYLVTGGLGGLGLRIARWLAESGARNIVLAGRTGLANRSVWDQLPADSLEARRTAGVKAIEDLGATVTIAALDVADEKAVSALIEGFPPEKLGGIIHAAAALGGCSLLNMNTQRLADILNAKTQGTWALHRATEKLNLDFFVLFSSSTSILGSRDLAHYAAANQFLDAFAEYRRRAGLPAVAVSWGAWPHFGNTSEEDRKQILRGGMIPMEWDTALAALGAALASATSHLFVGRFDWGTLKPLYETQRPAPLLEHVATAATVVAGKRETSRSAALLAEVKRTSGAERQAALIVYLADALGAILKIEPTELDPSRPVTDFGVDSLVALEFRNRVRLDLEFEITTVNILKGLSLGEMAALAAGALPAGAASPDVPSAAPAVEFPLSVGQQAMWFALKITPLSPNFNIAFTAKAEPRLAWEPFRRALDGLIARHAALRTIFTEDEEGRPVQRVLPSGIADLALVDAAGWSDEQVRDAVLEEFNKGFPLDRPPFCVRVFRRAESDVMLLNVHHIVSDAWSLRICFSELRALYAAALTGVDPQLPPLLAHYGAFVEAEAGLIEGPEGERQWNYWNRNIGSEPPLLQLPTSRPRPTVFLGGGESLPLSLGASRSARVGQLARERKVTAYAVLLAAYYVLLYHYTGQDDIVVGTSASGREDPRWANSVGYFVNLLPLRVKLNSADSFSDLLFLTRDTVLTAMEHQNLPFAHVVQRLRVRRYLDRSPVFQAFFNFLTDRSGDLGPLFLGVRDCAVEFGHSVLTPSTIIPQGGGQTEILIQLTEMKGEMVGNLNYNGDILDTSIAEEMVSTYFRILDTVLDDPNVSIDALKPARMGNDSELEDLVL